VADFDVIARPLLPHLLGFFFEQTPSRSHLQHFLQLAAGRDIGWLWLWL
jgi:hypothetical protein